MSSLWSIISFLSIAAAAAASAHLLLNYRRPTAAVAWFFALWSLPILGVICYLMFAVYQGPRRVRRRRKLSRNLRSGEQRHLWQGAKTDPSELSPVDDICRAIGALPLLGGNDVSLHPDADTARQDVLSMLEGATKEILLESYIWTDDEFTQAITEILTRKAAEGLEIRLLVDAIGSHLYVRGNLSKLPKQPYPIATFLPPNPLKGRLQVNFRNHRKLLVVDGERAVMGGRNYGSRYFDDGPDGIRDLSIAIAGPAVAPLRELFLEDWIVATEEESHGLPERPIPEPAGSVSVRVVPHGCDESCDVYVPMISTAIRSATAEILIVSPYFIPGSTILHDVRIAALSGVKVTILVPEKSPERWPEIAARRFYQELLEAGVTIQMRPEPFLHAKAVIVDQKWAVVGSANFDQRSFFLNYEISCEIADADFASALSDYFAPDIELSQRLGREEFEGRKWYKRAVENAAALFAPIL